MHAFEITGAGSTERVVLPLGEHITNTWLPIATFFMSNQSTAHSNQYNKGSHCYFHYVFIDTRVRVRRCFVNSLNLIRSWRRVRDARNWLSIEIQALDTTVPIVKIVPSRRSAYSFRSIAFLAFFHNSLVGEVLHTWVVFYKTPFCRFSFFCETDNFVRCEIVLQVDVRWSIVKWVTEIVQHPLCRVKSNYRGFLTPI